ncbi:sulfotransferase [Sphingobium lignivorans]|uniref:Sulfotransferase family protein n=1 Tax=Sphingobium lignivorans TaxID=2735886 RepID=A0ABR6NKF2_9SPHN|nr:sulfotransferase [Sphingobium lignivorans]MBB5987749.1 hypothetical protein [Sphingobium lignivorans]
MKRVIVSGMPRSGTSWTAKALSFAPGFTYYREPDNSDHVPGAPGPDYWNLYLKAGDDHPLYQAHMDRALSGQVATSFTMKEDQGPLIERLPPRLRGLGDRWPALYMRKPHVLVKLIRANLTLDWLAARYPEARIVSLVRHPVGQFASYQKLGWDVDPTSLLNDDRLVSEHLAPFTDLIRSAGTFWERAGALWGATMRVSYRQAAQGAGYHVVPFEWLCADGPARLEALSDRLGMAWTPAASQFAEPERGAEEGSAYSLRRDSRSQIDKWRKFVAPEDIEACRAFAEPFGVPVYDGFDPWKAEPIWSGTPR